jgi:hypothetical protein
LYLEDSGKHHLVELYHFLHTLDAMISKLTDVGQSAMLVSSSRKVDKGAVGLDSCDTTADHNALIQFFGVLKIVRKGICMFIITPSMFVISVAIIITIAVLFPGTIVVFPVLPVA